ncbi:MAG: ATP-grasp domain-containing protein [Candidatus Aminicenantaceae bacterium]
MKIAVIYNRDSEKVINLFGIPNREKYGIKSINRIADSLKQYKHQVMAYEGDKDLINNLEEFMPRVIKGETPGLAFNLSYGIQGQARYTHVPGILEMVGIPYVGSNPLAHSLALDKVVAKMIFRQHNLPTPDFVVIKDAEFKPPDLVYPLIVKPKNEAVSMGIQVVQNFEELQQAARVILNDYNQAVLVEQYISGREINVGLLGNNPPEALPPCEIVFGEEGPDIYTIEDKKGKSGRTIDWLCPAPLGEELTEEAKRLAKEAFSALGCYDMARVDMRLDDQGRLYILEVNSLPALGEHGSYTIAAKHAGLDFAALVNRMVEVASARYFGTPNPPFVEKNEKVTKKQVFSFITSHRDQIERSVAEWVRVSSRTSDPVGNTLAFNKLETRFQNLNMKPVAAFSDKRSVGMWETKAGFKGGTLLIGHLDVPLDANLPRQPFRKDPEWLYGEGIGTSRAPLVMMDFALRALRFSRKLYKLPLGVLYYLDEGGDNRYSGEIIQEACSLSRRVLVLRPGGLNGRIFVQRRGWRKFQLTVEGPALRPGQAGRSPDLMQWTGTKIHELYGLGSRQDRLAVTIHDIFTEHFPLLVPHQVKLTILVSYLDERKAHAAVTHIKELLRGSKFKIHLELVSDRPPMHEKKTNLRLAQNLADVAKEWDIPYSVESSLWPSAGGWVSRVPVVCGLGPAPRDLYTPQEAVNRTSLIQRTLLLAEYLAENLGK